MFNIIWQFVMVKQSIDTHKQTIDAHTTQTIDTHKQTIDAQTSGRMSPPRVVVDALSLSMPVLHTCRLLVSLADRPNHLMISPRG